jgi:hypothetical protein
MRATDALGAGMMVNALGQPEFPNISMGGGSLFPGLSVVTSQTVPAGHGHRRAAERNLPRGRRRLHGRRQPRSVAADARQPDERFGGLRRRLRWSVLWQTNSVGFRCERILNWKKRRTTAVAYLTGVAWGGAVNDLS